jgi:gliding motility-associated-like protein
VKNISLQIKTLINLFAGLVCLFVNSVIKGQTPIGEGLTSIPSALIAKKLNSTANADNNLFGTGKSYIENAGQYGEMLPGYERMGKILFAYEGMGMPVLFTEKGVIHLQGEQKKVEYESEKEREMEEKRIRHNRSFKVIATEWLNCNPAFEIIAEHEQQGYHTYGLLQKQAKAFAKIIYKNVYGGVDVVYSFLQAEKPGYEFSLIIRPGADLAAVKMIYSGDVLGVIKDKKQDAVIKTAYGNISQSAPISFYEGGNGGKIETYYQIENNTLGFVVPQGFDNTKTLIIDPFVTTTGVLTGINSGIAKDIDFDYAGNIYVSGGGDGNAQKMAKFSPTGALLWTFSGSLTTPFWNFGNSYGGWVVDKTNGNILLGQGLAGAGFSVIRLNTAGVYDNYITTANSSFTENWKMIWSCNSGTPKILIAGGGGSANNELAVLPLASTVPTTSNLSGLSGGHNDISDIVIDPVSNDMFTIYSRPVTGTPAGNTIYKHPPPYTSGTIAWQFLTTYGTLREPANRPYLAGLDNSSNTLAVNSKYLFYWDGKNLAAYNKLNGSLAGTDIIFNSNLPLLAGGVFADACDNVFIGFTNGVVKVLKFNGTGFDDAAAPDIIVTNTSGGVYDLAFDDGQKLLYVSGNGFVAAVDISPYCPSTHYTMGIADNCLTKTINVTVSPLPPTGISLSFALYDGTTLISSNTNGVFTGLLAGINYTVKAFLNQACGGTQLLDNFAFANTASLITTDPPAVCLPDGTADLTAASITNGSEAGLSFTYWLDAAATIPFTAPMAARVGTYFIKGTPSDIKCPSVKPVVVPSLPVPITDAGSDIIICSGQNTQLDGLAGAVAYSWIPAIFLDNPSIRNPNVINPKPGSWIYNLTITDANGCRSLANEQVIVTVTPPPKVGLPMDTLIVRNQPLQLNAGDLNNSGIINYTWSPPTGLNDPLIKNPVAIIDRDIMYRLDVSTAAGCKGTTFIIVKVYDKPDIHVPTAFTPGGDGLNDLLRAVPVGIREFHFLKVYNRWGQLVFATSDYKKGWDGIIDSKVQGSNVYVWIAEAVDYKGNLIRKKGTVTLIR